MFWIPQFDPLRFCMSFFSCVNVNRWKTQRIEIQDPCRNLQNTNLVKVITNTRKRFLILFINIDARIIKKGRHIPNSVYLTQFYLKTSFRPNYTFVYAFTTDVNKYLSRYLPHRSPTTSIYYQQLVKYCSIFTICFSLSKF